MYLQSISSLVLKAGWYSLRCENVEFINLPVIFIPHEVRRNKYFLRFKNYYYSVIPLPIGHSEI